MSEKSLFPSLMVARLYRDSYAEEVVDCVTYLMDREDAEELVERCCCTEGDWKGDLWQLRDRLDRAGVYYWDFFSELIIAIQWIHDEERRQVAELTRKRQDLVYSLKTGTGDLSVLPILEEVGE